MMGQQAGFRSQVKHAIKHCSTIPKVEKLKCDLPRNKCAICGEYGGFKKGDLAVNYLHDVFQNRFEWRYAHMFCVLRLWDAVPMKKLWKDAQNYNLLEAV